MVKLILAATGSQPALLTDFYSNAVCTCICLRHLVLLLLAVLLVRIVPEPDSLHQEAR